MTALDNHQDRARSADDVLAAGSSASRVVARSSWTERAAWLRTLADALDATRDDLVPIAARESHLPEPRLLGELARTTFQARLIADRLEAGALHEARIDHADTTWGMGPRPDIRRTVVPLGLVLVFAASNFPFAFSVAGGDSVSALAAGCPVAVELHPGHPRLGREVARIVRDALGRGGAPAGVFGAFEGEQAGADAVRDPRVRAAAFTGSTRGGRALFDLAVARPDPIPFYGELGSTNPVIVTPDGWAQRPDDIATGFAASVTLGSGQFCTKPGIVFVPDAEAFLSRVPDLVSGPMLNDRIASGFLASATEMAGRAAVARGPLPGAEPSPVLFRITLAALLEDLELLDAEVFGPAALVVEYPDLERLADVVDRLPGQLTATVQGGPQPGPGDIDLLARLAEHVGRVLWNDWPTGVTVTDAQQHGGPYPATTAPLSTSVGTAAVARFLRPVAFQNVPDVALPRELRDPA